MCIDVSVIVPVYNTASYLPKCLDSLCAQTKNDIEFILINDGSTDGSENILEEYVRKDQRFRLISQENRGFAGARNRGLQEAQGEFIGFVDSDDWIDPEMYEKLWEQHITDPQADIVQCSCVHEYLDNGISIPADNSMIRKLLERSGGKLTGAEAIILDDGTIWNRIYRRSMVVEHNLCFREEMTFGEDVFFYWTALIAAVKITAMPMPFYHYRRNRPGSQVFCGDKRIFAYFKTMTRIDEFVKALGRTDLLPWINHLKLSYPSWGFERLNPEFHLEYFQQYQKFLADTGMNLDSAISFPSLSGNLMYDIRYLLLRILHPLILKAIVTGNFTRFKKITIIRHFLSQLPVKLKCLLK